MRVTCCRSLQSQWRTARPFSLRSFSATVRTRSAKATSKRCSRPSNVSRPCAVHCKPHESSVTSPLSALRFQAQVFRRGAGGEVMKLVRLRSEPRFYWIVVGAELFPLQMIVPAERQPRMPLDANEFLPVLTAMAGQTTFVGRPGLPAQDTFLVRQQARLER